MVFVLLFDETAQQGACGIAAVSTLVCRGRGEEVGKRVDTLWALKVLIPHCPADGGGRYTQCRCRGGHRHRGQKGWAVAEVFLLLSGNVTGAQQKRGAPLLQRV